MHSNHRPDVNRFVWRRTVAALALFVIVGGAIAAVWKFSKRAPRTTAGESTFNAMREPVAVNDQPPSLAGYVGSAACARCHTEIAESFKTHPMSRSISRVDPIAEAARLDPQRARVVGKQRVLEVDIDGGIMRHHEKIFDDDGDLIYDQAIPTDYVVGSGRRAMPYLHRRDSLLFMSPLNWYAQSGQRAPAPRYSKHDSR